MGTGLTTVAVRIANFADRTRAIDAEMLVDSGAIFSVVPGRALEALGVEPEGTEQFFLADGTSLVRPVGTAFFEVAGKRGASAVVFGEPDEVWLLGALTLQSLGLMLDPLKRRLRPMRLVLLACTADPPASQASSS